MTNAPKIPRGRPVRVPVVAVTADRGLVHHLAKEFGAHLADVRGWPDPGVRAEEVLLLDLAVLPQSRWPHLVRRSRQTDRPEIVLLDDHAVPRTILARLAADVLIQRDTSPADIAAVVREHTIGHVFRATAEAIKVDPGLPYPLSMFLGAACVDRIDRVGALADAYGFKHSTLRNQWRACRPDSSVRLEDVVREFAQIRALAVGMSRHDLRSKLEHMRQRCFVGLRPIAQSEWHDD